VPALPEPALDARQQALFERGWQQFDAGQYFACHDTLEELWQEVRGPARDFFQGLVQWAVAFHHLSRGNLAGARSLLSRAELRQRDYPAHYCGLDLGDLRTQGQAWRAYLESASPTPRPAPPRWRALRPDSLR
jgi:hypothetical protein